MRCTICSISPIQEASNLISKGPSLVLLGVWLGCCTLARAAVIYDFSGGTIFPGTATFQYISPTFVTANLSVPAPALDSCEVSGTIMGSLFCRKLFSFGPGHPHPQSGDHFTKQHLVGL